MKNFTIYCIDLSGSTRRVSGPLIYIHSRTGLLMLMTAKLIHWDVRFQVFTLNYELVAGVSEIERFCESTDTEFSIP